MRTKAHKPPFKIGTKVRYPGPDFQMEGGPWVRQGDVGVVVGYIDPLDGSGDVEPFDGCSIIKYHDSERATRAVSRGTVRRESWDGTISEYEAVDESAS